jgi:uncharacterized Zn-binding protein involved in type VI secretion
MPAIQRVGDRNEQGGVILNGDNSVLINGRPVAIESAKVTPHPCCGQQGCPPVHCNAQTTAKTGTVLVNGKRIIITTDVDNCGHQRSGGSPDVSVG